MNIEEAKLGQTVYVKGIITDIDKDEIFDLERHKRKKIDNVIKQISKSIGVSIEITKKSFMSLIEAFYDKK
ncbi:TPA: hypothetical protein VA477_001972 [Streptococcus agalactiae]|nr:hypothetical protein [Streptococcus agalactiae]